MEADTEVIGGSALQQHLKRFFKEGAAAAHKEEMEEKKEQKINEDNIGNNKEMKMNTETEEATNMRAETEVIGGSRRQQQAERGHEGGAAAARTEETENRITEAIEAKNSEKLATGTISRQTRIRDGWESDEVEEENTLDSNGERRRKWMTTEYVHYLV